MKYFTQVGEKTFEIEIVGDGTVIVDGTRHHVQMDALGASLSSLLIDSRSYDVVVQQGRDEVWHVLAGSEQHRVSVQDELSRRVAQARRAARAALGEVELKSPMPGLIVKVPVQPGDAVRQGQTLVILESMKMENELKSPRDGVVKGVYVTAGSSVEKDQKLATVGDADAAAPSANGTGSA